MDPVASGRCDPFYRTGATHYDAELDVLCRKRWSVATPDTKGGQALTGPSGIWVRRVPMNEVRVPRPVHHQGEVRDGRDPFEEVRGFSPIRPYYSSEGPHTGF